MPGCPQRHGHPARLAEAVTRRLGAFDRKCVTMRLVELHGHPPRRGGAEEDEDLPVHLRDVLAPRLVFVRGWERKGEVAKLVARAGHGHDDTAHVATPIIIDCDPGHDDAIAILLALASPEVELEGITTVHGNQTLEKTTRNALRVLEPRWPW